MLQCCQIIINNYVVSTIPNWQLCKVIVLIAMMPDIMITYDWCCSRMFQGKLATMWSRTVLVPRVQCSSARGCLVAFHTCLPRSGGTHTTLRGHRGGAVRCTPHPHRGGKFIPGISEISFRIKLVSELLSQSNFKNCQKQSGYHSKISIFKLILILQVFFFNLKL